MNQYLRPLYLILIAGSTALVACTNSSVTGTNEYREFEDAYLLNRTFQIQDVAGRGVIDSSNVTLIFGQEGQFSGSMGCNSAFGSYKRSGADIEFGALGATRKMCVPALMNQEQMVLEILSDVTRIEQDKEGALILRTTDGRSLRGFESTQSTRRQAYLCDDGVTVEAVYPTRDTARIVYQGQTFHMTIAPSASGARYTGGGWQWWSKGAVEAYLSPLAAGETIASDKGIACSRS